ncbi:multicomponent Na+:H+ antiporter subunit B [Halanaerobium sp. DL-01]|uniref:hydrogen gas-evolving membrane-bound hydrogenase subunit E n=1 Tax=Halanaerobium sp. DL-01 TaxID=1653064 RepID=UPI000DF237DA|nr:hydrogen gas-evolving membrane-bound hydrogenase subunit E [Halanaerobium sp. DL-01]RCW88551.1 multicomponent Na+:H+ antiporter subunit B [Halanaerobium sp. DL-01]
MKKKLTHIAVITILAVSGAAVFFNLKVMSLYKDIPRGISRYFISFGLQDTGSLNLVTAILYDYRAFDSLGESTVIFGAVSGIVLILSRKMLPVSSQGLSFIVKRTLGIMTPFIALFSIYVITHGHLSPGGGFQGGVILAAISIIFSIVYGSAFDYKRYSPQMKTAMETTGALMFISIGVLGIFFEGFFLDNLNFLGGKAGTLISAGSIPIINIGIGLKVGAGLAIIFYSMIQKTFREEL